MLKQFFILILIVFSLNAVISQSINNNIDYFNPKEYIIGDINVSGIKIVDKRSIISITGLTVGEKIMIPGEKISNAIKKLWDQGLFSNIDIRYTKIEGNIIYLDIYLQERKRISYYKFEGIKKSEADNIKDKIKINKGDIVTDNLIKRIKSIITEYYIDKGYLFNEVYIKQKDDTIKSNYVGLIILINKNNKIKINKINIKGNNEVSSKIIKRSLKKTKEQNKWNIFKSSRFIHQDFEKDKDNLIEKYNSLGYRDMKIIKDSISKYDNKHINLFIEIEEGNKFYFRNISWVGNTKYTNKELSQRLRIKKGDIYNSKLLQQNLYMSPDGNDVSSLYLDDGYLFFSAVPIETIDGDSIDIEIRIYEGKQATINKVSVVGNNKTNDHVIMREIRTKPGQLFNRSDIIRTQRELAQLNYFNPEKLNVNPKPNPAEGTVDIEYVVEEKSTDQIELSGGWGGGRVIGTFGVGFNNFSVRKILKSSAWTPLPSGDGQRLAIRAQSDGLYYQSYSASFTEPWLGGRKPNSLSISIYNSIQTNGEKKGSENRQSINILGASVGLGRRLKWPDDYFTLYNGLTYQNYTLNNFSSVFSFSNGYSNCLNLTNVISRNSIDQPIYPRSGSEISLTIQLTPPFSILKNINYKNATDQEKYKWIEYHKWKFSTSSFIKLYDNFVLNTKTQFGFLALYNRNIGMAPFERFYLGGDGMYGYALDGREIIALRGYTNNSLSPSTGGTIYAKYTAELRYPLSLNPATTIYLLTFVEAGDSWTKFNQFNPFSVHRSAGIGVRLFLPMFQLGLDWGYGFDEVKGNPSANKGQFHFTIAPPY